MRSYNNYVDEWNNPETRFKQEDFEQWSQMIKDEFYECALNWYKSQGYKRYWLRDLK